MSNDRFAKPKWMNKAEKRAVTHHRWACSKPQKGLRKGLAGCGRTFEHYSDVMDCTCLAPELLGEGAGHE